MLVVGILGEDRLTCIDPEDLGFPRRGLELGACAINMAAVLFIAMCVMLLSSEVSQVMAADSFGRTNYRAGAAFGIVLCSSIPPALWMWKRHERAKLLQLIKAFPPVTGASIIAPGGSQEEKVRADSFRSPVLSDTERAGEANNLNTNVPN